MKGIKATLLWEYKKGKNRGYSEPIVFKDETEIKDVCERLNKDSKNIVYSYFIEKEDVKCS